MNTYREPEASEQASIDVPTPKPRKKGRIGKSIHHVLNGEFLTKEGLINHLPFIGFLVGLFILHISLMYFFENTQRELARKQHELNELRSQYNTTMSILETRKQQSNVALSIEQLGLKELRTPPLIIDVEKGYFQEND
jgi:Bacteriodetes cell division protein (FtsL-like)